MSKINQTSPSVLDRYEAVIGLEVHCQLKTNTKLFCSCTTKFGELPNHNTCEVCLGLPGVLPVLNRQAVDFAIRFALAVKAKLNEKSVFSRKQYFYPDLPKGYQISQYDLPYCEKGELKLASGKTIRITRAHLEEDAGKNVHGDQSSYVDLNRAGVALIEIVSEPDIRLPSEAAEYLKKLRSLVRYLEICDGNLEEGSFRCDANVSIRPRGQEKLGTRCEIKNLNSFRNIERAIQYEIIRQADVIDSGGKIIQQTLSFDAATGKTASMRSKEESHDYRYFPEPDLKPLFIDEKRIAHVKLSLPELPEARASRFQEAYGLSEYDAGVLTAEKELAAFYEDVVQKSQSKVSPKIAANWVCSEFLRELNNREWDICHPPISSSDMAELLVLIGTDKISGKIAKTVFEEMAEKGGKPQEIVEKKGLTQVVDEGAIQALIAKVLKENEGQVQEYQSGKVKLFGFFVGEVMKACQGKMNPGLVNEALKAQLNQPK